MFNQDMQTKLRIDAAEQLAAAKERQPGMGDVDLSKEDDVRIGDEYHINYSEPAPSPPSTVAPTKSNSLGTLGSMAAGAALLASGAGLANLPAMLQRDPPAAVQPDPRSDADTVTDLEIRGGVKK